MPERKCDYPPLVRMSDGRTTCPDNFFRSYREKGNCQECQKAKNTGIARRPTDFMSEEDRIISRIVSDIKYETNAEISERRRR